MSATSLPSRMIEQLPDVGAAEANVHSAAAGVGVAISNGAFSTVEWNGPEQLFFECTQLNFIEGRLLSYTIERCGGLQR